MIKIKQEIVNGWFLVTGAYFITLMIVARSYTAITGLPIDHQRDLSGLVLGCFMVVVPYIVGGYYVRKTAKHAVGQTALWVGIVPSISEKVLIYLIAAFFVASGGDGGGDGIVTYRSVMGFAEAEAVPYFTTLYLITAPLSIVVCVLTAAYSPGRPHSPT
ncbi:hypothetical protein [Brevibacillus migulae]|uniref:hypothetical protein n=1 Tax=Brevibacillus migulae TaxID=1644114 RepID=UPI00106EBD1B|nr:hypothetical protein [Brevibacillus migulae]